jgi:hypothetical protein
MAWFGFVLLIVFVKRYIEMNVYFYFKKKKKKKGEKFLLDFILLGSEQNSAILMSIFTHGFFYIFLVS